MTAKKIKTKENVLELIRSNQDKIRSYGVRKLGLFGSFVRGEQKPESDIDLLVEFQQDKKSFDNFIHTYIQLAFFLEEILESRVELITIDALSPYIGPHC